MNPVGLLVLLLHFIAHKQMLYLHNSNSNSNNHSCCENVKKYIVGAMMCSDPTNWRIRTKGFKNRITAGRATATLIGPTKSCHDINGGTCRSSPAVQESDIIQPIESIPMNCSSTTRLTRRPPRLLAWCDPLIVIDYEWYHILLYFSRIYHHRSISRPTVSIFIRTDLEIYSRSLAISRSLLVAAALALSVEELSYVTTTTTTTTPLTD